MNKIKLFKKYSDGEVRSVDVNDNKESVIHLLDNGFFLTKEEAEAGKVKDENPAPKKAPARKPAPKK